MKKKKENNPKKKERGATHRKALNWRELQGGQDREYKITCGPSKRKSNRENLGSADE